MDKKVTNSFRIKILVFQVLCAGIAVSLGMMWGVKWELSKYENKFYNNIVIADVEVGNKTIDEAISFVEDHYLYKFLESNLSVSLNEQTFKAPIKNFFIDSNLNDIVETAFNYPKELTFLEKFQLLIGKTKKVFDIQINFDRVAMDAFVESIVAQVGHPGQNAMIRMSHDKGASDPNKINITPHVPGTHIDKEALVQEIEVALNERSSLVIDGAPFMSVKEPTITTESLQTIDTLIASTDTIFTPGTGSATNIKVSAQVIDGILLMPGDTFSFNDSIGNTTLEKGYTYAPSIINSKYVQDLGGGVCQLSSTLYNTALRAGLGSVSRRPHSKPSSYVPLGLDATISWGSIDYQFENTLNYPIYIEAYTKTNRLYVNMYSNSSLKDTKYKIKSEVYKVLSSPVQYITDSTLPKGTKKLVQPGEEGYQVKVIREVYEKDTLKDTEVISYDTYKPTPTIYKQG